MAGQHPGRWETKNAQMVVGRKKLTSLPARYNDLPDKDKNKPSVDSTAYLPNVRYLEAVGATQKPGDRKLWDQDD